MSGYSETSLLAYDALDLATCERELLNWFMAQPRGYAATRHVIADLMHKDLSWVCGRAKALIDAGVLESLKAISGRHPLRLKVNGAMQQQAQRSSVATQERLQIEPCDRSGLMEQSARGWKTPSGLSETEPLRRAPLCHPSVNDDHAGRLNRSLSARTTGKGCPGDRSATSVAPALPHCSTPIDTTSESYRHECEIRFVANLPNDAARNRYLTRVHEKRGEAAWKRLREDAWRAMRAADRVAA